MIEKAFEGKHKRVAVSIGPQLGKALEVSTPIPTPDGWRRIDALKSGDSVFDENGRVCRVVARSEVFKDRQVYEVRTDDGYSVIADAAHEWPVRMSRSYPVKKLKTTAKLFRRKAERNVRLAIGGALDLPDIDLPIEPYCLGAWLGDGSSSGAVMTAPGEDGAFIERQFQEAGYTTRRHKDSRNFGIVNRFCADLVRAGLARDKHIPPLYMRASVAQRLALLQGLIDTDGYCGPNGNIEFCNTNEELAEGVRQLVVSLGRKCRLSRGRATLYGKDCGPKFRVCFYMKGAARLPRKAQYCRDAARMSDRYLTVREAGRADTVCIQVDSPSHLFLCGRGMLVTHNSEVLTRCAPTWWLGRRPHANMIIGAYNQPFANTFGSDIQAILDGNPYKQVFPEIELRENAKDYMVTTREGKISLVGVGGSGTGKPADVFIVDDPTKNADDANSENHRNGVWDWFSGVVFSRLHNDSVVIVVHTRWHEDDLIGRLCDPSHPDRNTTYKGIADDWLYINLPAVVTDPALADALGLTLKRPTEAKVLDQFGDQPMSALWPERKGLKLLAEARGVNKQVFESLYMGNPTPADGDYFTADMLVEYEPDDLPRDLMTYGASDHAVSEKQVADSTVIGCVGVDSRGEVWVLPELVWGKMMTDRMVEEILAKMQNHKPGVWWMESELISKSFGPFLLDRMEKTNTYCTLNPVTPSRDKQARARAIQGMMQRRKVHFPRFAPWWRDARAQLLKFPYGAHDDFVDWLSWLGLGLRELHSADEPESENIQSAPTGSIGWILRQTAAKALRENRRNTRYG